MTYNLLEERWIPVLWTDGKPGRVGIKYALTQAGTIRQIAASNPMDRVAILRFLLAVLYWCRGNPPTDPDATSRDLFPSDWFKKLDDNKDCFNLFGEERRFYQYRESSSAKDKKLSANYLVQEVPTGTNIAHFRHARDKVNGLCPACCAMGLLRLPVFATSAGRGKPPGINQKPPIYVIPVGASLAATLRLSWRQASNLGTPTWKKPDLQLPKTGDVPLLTGLTWLPRRVWLDNPGETAPCIACGSRENLILQMVFAPIGSQKTDEDGSSRNWRDPHVIYVQKNKGEIRALYAGNVLAASGAATGQWANIMAGILREQKANDNVSVWVVGFATVKNDKCLEAMEYGIFFPNASDDQKIQESIAKIEMWQKEVSSLTKRIRPEASSRKHGEIAALFSSVGPHVEAMVSAKAGELLAGGDGAWEQAAREYRPMMEMIAQSLSPGFTTAAVRRRRHISRVAPDVRSSTEATQKPGRKEGGDK